MQGVLLYHALMYEAPFYSTPGCGPYYNMAFDEWLFSRALARKGSIYLRLYTWQPGAITFGFNQRSETALDFDRLDGTPVVRRITGGRALYHDPSELTYSIVVNAENLPVPSLSGTLSKTSEVIALALASFLKNLSIETSYVRKSSPSDMQPDYFHKAPCFASAARHELLAGNRKIVASAQKRLGMSMLQHGSIKLHGVVSHAALGSVGEVSNGRLQAVGHKAFKDFARLFCITVGESLGVIFRPCDATDAEEHAIRLLASQVEKNALAKRVIVAQNDAATSL